METTAHLLIIYIGGPVIPNQVILPILCSIQDAVMYDGVHRHTDVLWWILPLTLLNLLLTALVYMLCYLQDSSRDGHTHPCNTLLCFVTDSETAILLTAYNICFEYNLHESCAHTLIKFCT